VLSRGFAEMYERDRGVAHVHVIPNWISEDIAPDPEAGRVYRRDRGIPDDAFLVVYGGNVGVAANVEQLIEATRTLDVHLLIAGSGPRVAACRAISHERVLFEDPWPVSMTAAVLSAADLLALPTLGEQSFVSVPSKLLTYLLMDKPILAIAPPDSEIARVIADANAGRAVQTNIAEAIRTTRGGGGREYVLREFSRDACLPRILELLR
jgi:glycosyltransferase involved in cell wall biosynthesis